MGRVANTLLAQLASEGLTAAMVTNINTQVAALDSAIDNVHTAELARDVATEDRILKGNALWAEMVRLAGIGKSIFADVDEAKYNDYVLTDEAVKHPEPPNP